MKEMMKDLIKSTVMSIGMALTIFCIVGIGILAAGIQFALAFILWGGFMIHYRNEARKMNTRIQQMK